MNKKFISFIISLLFIQLACVVPAIQQLGQPQQVIVITATAGETIPAVATQVPPSTQTPLPEVFDCKELESGKPAVVNAKPVGVYLRVSPDSNIIIVIPDSEPVEVFGSYDNGWSLIRWNDVCGYVSSKYVIGQ